MASIKLENITKRFDDITAIKNMNLEIQDKELFVLLGPTNAGKTTTLRCIAGLEKPEAGNIYIADVLSNDFTPAERDVAFVFQNHILYPHLTVYENMAFPLKPRKISKAEIDKRVREVSSILHIENLLGRKPNQLSGGETQRVGLGRAMVRQPRLFLMDEPLSNLDAKLRIEMRAWLKWQQRQLDTTMLYVTHDQVEAMSMADRVAVLNGGVIQQIGTPMAVYNQPVNQFVALFLGSPGMNLQDCHLTTSEGKLFVEIEHSNVRLQIPDELRQKIDGKETGDELTFGIRAEDILLAKESQSASVQTKVYLVEPLGAENIIDLSIGQEPTTNKKNLLKAKTPPDFDAKIGETLWMNFVTDRMHIFDKKNGKAIF